MAQNPWDAFPVAPAQNGPLPSPPKVVTPPAPKAPPTAFEIEDQGIKRAKDARERAEWTATHNLDGSKKTPDQMPQAYSQSAMDAFNRAIDSAKRLKVHPGFSAMVGSGFDPASFGSFNPLPFADRETPFAGTDAANFKAELDSMKAQVFLPMVQSMKGMGALSNAEGQKLTDAIGAMDTHMSESAFSSSLNRIIKDLTTYRDRGAGKSAARPVLRPKAASGWGAAKVVE